MKISLLTLTGVFLIGTLSAQNREKAMNKYQDQLPQNGRGNSQVAYQNRSIDQMIYEFMQEKGIPGMTLAIVQAPYIPRVVGYGVTDLETQQLASTGTIWPAGPISQGFAAVAVMQLYERGKLDLNEPIGTHLKHLPEAWTNITVKQLMQHSTGISDYRFQNGYDPSKSYTEKELIESVRAIPLAFAPGTDVQQSATNFLLLADVIERVGKMPYREFVKKHQIEYLGLRETFFSEDLPDVKQENVRATGNIHQTFKHDKDYIDPSETTTGYKVENGKLVKTQAINSAALKGFADIYASAGNISFWDIGLAGSVLIEKPENRAVIYSPTTLDNGKVVPAMAGWQFYNHRGLMDIKGSVAGHSAFLSRFTDASELVCVTLMCNQEGVDLTNLARRIAAAFDDDKMGTGSNDNELYTYESQFSVDETVSRIEANLKSLNIPVFAMFDHRKNALEVGMELRPTKVIVFGSPKVGTKLMQENPSISIELPLRISVWEDKNGSVWLAFPQMYEMAARYGMENNPIVDGMETLLENIVRKSSSVY